MVILLQILLLVLGISLYAIFNETPKGIRLKQGNKKNEYGLHEYEKRLNLHMAMTKSVLGR